MRCGSLFYGGTKGIEGNRAFEVRRRMLQPNQTAVVQMGKDSGNGAASAVFQPGQFGSPGARLKVLKQDLIHPVVGRIDFQQDFANV